MSESKKCSGCYNSFSGWWCENCDTWPCKCLDDPEVQPKPTIPETILAMRPVIAGIEQTAHRELLTGLLDQLESLLAEAVSAALAANRGT